MNEMRKLAVLSALPVAAALIALPAQAAERPACPVPTGAAAKRSSGAEIDMPPRGAATVEGIRVGHIPKGFAYGQVVVNEHDGITEYGYQWGDDRSEVDPEHRSLWVRVVCWPKASGPAQLKNAPFDLGTFSGDTETVRIGARQVLTREGDGALGHGRYAGWVERKGVVVTVMASRPLVPELTQIIKSIRL
ncbi:hypothetical protein GCM10010126_63740 [Planomonospora parontospora]|uniref:Uncharacterized protein n=2 Tax=Planomonospora parontospora TaxID=58119 RepID=A0AA37BND9_9ACTN|nr:hypothetical protein [Planomonospora parontospora]GGK95608.1 hypothetical protein GCM10010126_63740 [Planomonospora parontospora]